MENAIQLEHWPITLRWKYSTVRRSLEIHPRFEKREQSRSEDIILGII
jgi:hypothetical protein